MEKNKRAFVYSICRGVLTLRSEGFFKNHEIKFYALCAQLYMFVGESKLQSRRILPIFVVMCKSAIRSARREYPSHGAKRIMIRSLLFALTQIALSCDNDASM